MNLREAPPQWSLRWKFALCKNESGIWTGTMDTLIIAFSHLQYSVDPKHLKRFLDPGDTCIERSLVSSSTKYFSKAFRRFRTWEFRTHLGGNFFDPSRCHVFPTIHLQEFIVKQSHLLYTSNISKDVCLQLSNTTSFTRTKISWNMEIYQFCSGHFRSGTDSCSVPRWFCTLRWCMAKRASEATMPGVLTVNWSSI